MFVPFSNIENKFDDSYLFAIKQYEKASVIAKKFALPDESIQVLIDKNIEFEYCGDSIYDGWRVIYATPQVLQGIYENKLEFRPQWL